MGKETDAVVPLCLRCFVRQPIEVAKDGHHGLWVVFMEHDLLGDFPDTLVSVMSCGKKT